MSGSYKKSPGRNSEEKVDIDLMIQACTRETHRPEGKKVVIRYTPKKGLYVIGTPLLKEVFCNLIDNSIKYSREEVEVDIQVKEHGKSTAEGLTRYRSPITVTVFPKRPNKNCSRGSSVAPPRRMGKGWACTS